MFEAMKDLMDSQRRIRTRQALGLGQIHSLLVSRVDTARLGTPELKHGLLSDAIVFPKVAGVTPRITVTGTEVMVGQIQDDSGSPSPIGSGGRGASREAERGTQYFKAVADAVTDALADQ